MKLAFGYKMRSGKDTASNYLIKKYGGIKISFSKYIYNILHYTQNICNFDIKKDRYFLRFIGEWAKKQNPDVWINLSLNDIIDNDNNYFCSDLRFKNEYNILKKNNWICIKIIRNTGIKDYHISETDLDDIEDWDYIIHNNGTLEDFKKSLDNLIQNIQNKK